LCRRGTLAEVLAEFRAKDNIRGEMVLVVEGAAPAVAGVAEAGAQAALAASAAQAGGGDYAPSSPDGSGGDDDAAAASDVASDAAAAAGAAAAAAASAQTGDDAALRRMIADLLRAGGSVSSVSKDLSKQLGIGRSQLYKLVLQVEDQASKAPKQ
jgi:hypothetical protein